MSTVTRLARFSHFILAHRVVVISLVSLTTLILGIGALGIHIDLDPDEQLPQSHPYIKTLNRTHDLFGDKNLVIIGLRPNDGDSFSPTFLEKLRTITRAISSLPGVDTTLLKSLASPNATFVRRAPSELIVEPAVPEHITRNGTHLRDRTLSHPIFRGTLASYDGSTLALYCTINLTPTLPGYVNVHRAVLDVLQTEDDGTFSYYLSGPVVIASRLNSEASKSTLYLLLSLLVIGAIHYHAFRSWQAVLLPIITGLTAVVWAMGAMGYLKLPLDPFNATTPILILAVGAGHAVQLLKRYYEELESGLDNDQAIARSVDRAGGTMIAAGAIAIASFLSLATVGTHSMRTFGILTAFGIASALLIEMTLIPAVRSFAGQPGRHPSPNSPKLEGVLEWIARSASSKRTAQTVLIAYGSIVALCGLFAGRIQVDTSFKRNLSPSDVVRRDDDILNQLFAGTNDLLFLLEARRENALTDPDVVAAIARFQQRVQGIAGVGTTLSFVDTLRIIHEAIKEPSDNSELPDSQRLASQYLFLYSMSGGSDLETMLSPDHRIAKISVLLHPDSTRYGEDVIRQATQIAQEELPDTLTMSASGTLASNAALTEVMVRGKLLNVLQVIFITAAVAAIMFRSIPLGILVVVPVGASITLIFGLMGIAGVPMDVGSSVVCALSVGIGADYAVYFLARIQEELSDEVNDYETAIARASTTSGAAIAYVASAIGLGYLTLCLSGFRLFEQLGTMVAIAMLSAAGSTLIVLPSLLTCLPHRFRATSRAMAIETTRSKLRRLGGS